MVLQWSCALASLLGVVLNIRKDRRCFYIWFVTNGTWAVVDGLHGIYAQCLLQAIYCGLSIWGILQWQRTGN